MRPKIDKKGVYRIPLDYYHSDCCAGPSISSSGLRTIFSKSPKHYFDTSYLNPDRAEPEEKEHFILGRAAHHLLLGEEDFSTQFIMRPEEFEGEKWNGNRKVCKAWLADQDSRGRTVLTPKQIEQIRGMAKALADEPLVKAGILNGEVERSLIWKDKATGIWLKSRPDNVPNDSGDAADLKLTSEVGFGLDRSVSNYRYDVQAALTKWAFREVLGVTMSSFSYVFVESKRPHCVETLTLPSEDIEDAERDLRVAIDTFAWCIEHKNWFGPAGTQRDARFVHISEFAKKDAEYRRDFLKREIARAERATTELEYAQVP